jgi:DNA-binding CsgD family transcriptional regulator
MNSSSTDAIPGRHIEWFSQIIPSDGDDSWDDWELYWSLYWDSIPCSYPDCTGDVRSVTKPLDFYSARQWHSTAMYSEFFRPMGMEHEMMLCLPAGYRRTIRLIFLRGSGPDFSERDRALLTLLRPYLHQAYLDAERRRHPTPHLTPRQRELLHLVAAGHTNSQAARRLGVSEGTVRTHLETSTKGCKSPAAPPPSPEPSPTGQPTRPAPWCAGSGRSAHRPPGWQRARRAGDLRFSCRSTGRIRSVPPRRRPGPPPPA